MTQQFTPAFSEPTLEETRQEIARHWGWFLILGILLVLIGMAAIAFPFLSTLAAKIAIGWMGTEFLPPFNEGTFTINVQTEPGTSLQ